MKNDRLDADAICEAAGRPHMRFVAVKTAAQQNVLLLHRMRNGFVEERTALVNRLRGELVEFGVFLPQGINAFRARFVEALEDRATELSGVARTALLRAWQHLQALDQQIAWCDAEVATQVKHDGNAQRAMAVIGIGPLTASAAVATVGDVCVFKNGRQFSAWLGSVPRQASRSGKTWLGRITRHGNTYLRTLGRSDCTSTDRPALALDRSAPGTCGLVSDAGGCRQQARSHPVGDSGRGRALRSVV